MLSAHAKDLPLSQDTSVRLFPWMMGMMMYAAVLACVCALWVVSAVRDFSLHPVGYFIILDIPVCENSASQELREKIKTLVQKMPHTSAVVPIPISRIQEALTAGENTPEGALQSISFPLLIDVVVQDNPGVTLPKLSAALAEIFPQATITPREGGGVPQCKLGPHDLLDSRIFCGLFVLAMPCGLFPRFTLRTSISIHQPVTKFLCF